MKKIILCLSLLTLVSCYKYALRMAPSDHLSIDILLSCKKVINDEFGYSYDYDQISDEDLLFIKRGYATCEKQSVCFNEYLSQSGLFESDDWPVVDSFMHYSSLSSMIEDMRENVPNDPEAQLRIDIFEQAKLNCAKKNPIY